MPIFWITLMHVIPAGAVILWNDPDTTLVHESGPGTDILGGAIQRDDSANDTLYFKFHVVPLSDKDTEPYFAAFELFEGDTERVAIGNAMEAWAYSAFFNGDESGESKSIAGYIDLHTTEPEPTAGGVSRSYQYPRRGVGVTIVFKIQYIPGEDDVVTVWLNPDLGPGANEAYEPEGLTTRFSANARFNQIRLRHSGQGGGWAFSDLAIATSFSDFVDASSARPSQATSGLGGEQRTLYFQTWQKEQGLPQGHIRALAQTQDGYVWIGSDDQVIRFDGLRFVPFGVQEGFKWGQVSAMLEDSRGALWVGSADIGLSCWQNQQITTLTVREGLPANSITALAEDTAGRLWIGSDAGLILWENGRLIPLEAADAFKGQRITALLKDRRGKMWMGVKNAGVFQFEKGRFAQLTADGMQELLKDSHCLLMDQAGRMWIGAGEDFVLCNNGDRWHRYPIPHNLVRSHVSKMAEESNGAVWVGSAGGGLLQFKEDGSTSFTPASGLAGHLIESLMTDREGRVWAGTEAGLNRIRRKSLFNLSQNEGLGFGTAQGVAEASPGVVWVGKPNGGLYRWDGKSFSHLSATGLSPHEAQVTTLLVTRDGFCWVATMNNLLLYKDPVAAADEVMVIKPAEPGIISLAEDREGALWTGTREGKIWQLRENKWLEQTNFSQAKAVTALVPDADGSMWVGTGGNGLYRLKNGSIEHYDKRNGLLSDVIQTLYLDPQNTLWIGTADTGMSQFRNGRIANFTTREGLPNNNVSQILEDDAGRLWLGTSGGIVCLNKRRLEELAAGSIKSIYPQVFGRADGMLSEECTGGFYPAGLKSKSGLLWFPTQKGVAVVNPRIQRAAMLVPGTVLEEVLVDGVSIPRFRSPNPKTSQQKARPEDGEPQPEKLRITPGKHRVEFRYTGLSFDLPESTRFRYRLDGLDTDWLDAGTRRTAIYNYLPPGDYRFRVTACNSDGVWGTSESALEVVVLRHVWQTWWFIMVTGISLLVFVAGTARIVGKEKLHRRLKRLEQERALERERTRIAQDLHDEMGAKLCRISFLSEHARRGDLQPEELQDQISSISAASREVLHSLDEIVWAVNPQNDSLEHVASYIGQYAQEYFQMTGIQCELDIPTQLPPHPLSSQMRHHLFLATHEAFTNILKHAGAARARVSMDFANEVFSINISDDGKGFNSAEDESKAEQPAAASGNGLINMCQRLADIGGSCEIKSAQGQGTNIRFVIDLNQIAKNVI